MDANNAVTAEITTVCALMHCSVEVSFVMYKSSQQVGVSPFSAQSNPMRNMGDHGLLLSDLKQW
jgi:hypothetical protein